MASLISELLPHRESVWRDIVIALLAFLSAGLLVFELSAELLPSQTQLIYTVDIVIALIFLGDFMYELSISPQKKAYLRKNWYLLLASIPITGGTFQSLRALQIVRLLRVVRLYARIRAVSRQSERIALHSSRYIFVALFATLLIFIGSALFYRLEVADNPAITTYYDAVWWAVVTATSVGYGDIVPYTPEGRLVAMVLMFLGLAMLGTIIGIVSNYFLTVNRSLPDDDVQ